MQLDARNRVRELTAVLTVLSLVLVFAAVRQAIPAGALPRVDTLVTAIPHLNAVISLSALVSIGAGVRAIRRGNVERHRAAMVATTGLFLLFLALYLYRVALEGPSPFPGPDTVYQFVYLPILAIHILLAIVAIPLVYYVLLVALTRPIEAIRRSPHPRVGRVAASLWFVSFFLGLVVYAMLYVVY